MFPFSIQIRLPGGAARRRFETSCNRAMNSGEIWIEENRNAFDNWIAVPLVARQVVCSMSERGATARTREQ